MRRRRLLRTIASGTAAGAFGVGRAAAGQQGEAPDRHVVGTDGPAAAAAAKRRADSVHRELDFGDIGQAVAGRFPDPALEALRKRPDVRYVEPEGLLRAVGESLPWGVDRVDADLARDDGYTGDGADIAIIDSGIDSDHPDLEGNLGAGEAFVECGKYPDGSDCTDTNGNDCLEPWDDDNDHGTHCAGIADARNNSTGVVGVSSQATLHAVKVLACDGYGTYSDVAAGITHVADQGWDVGSMSLGAGSDSSTVHDACKYAENNGVLLVAAAGNDGPCSDCVLYPAAYPEVVAVSATDSDDTLADFSCTGPEVELAAPGVNILSTVPGGTSYKSGTSMATPHVAGAGGLLMANGYSASEARDRLGSTAEDIGLGGNEQGNGLVDAEAAVQNTQNMIGEAGTISIDENWHTVSLDGSYTDPVVVTSVMSYNGSDPVHSRVRNAASGSFEVRLEEWEYLDGSHSVETVGYVVLEAGEHTTDAGMKLLAGTTTADGSDWTTVTFSPSWDAQSYVFTQVMSNNDSTSTATRITRTGEGTFDVICQEEESNQSGSKNDHANETVGLIAAQPQAATSGNPGESRATSLSSEQWSTATLESSYSEIPAMIHRMQSFFGNNTTDLRCKNASTDSFDIKAQEEQSADSETKHVREYVATLALQAGSITTN